MDILRDNFVRAHTLVQQNLAAADGGRQLPSQRVAQYLNTCTPGVLDIRDLMEADPTEFVQMAYYGLLGHLPEQEALQKWESWESEARPTEWAYRKAVLDALSEDPEVSAKGLVMRNNIYADEDDGRDCMKRSLKQRIWSLGYKFSRRLPLGAKIRLKKLAMRLFLRG